MDRCVRCSGDLDDLAVFCPHCAQPHEPDFDKLINRTIDDRYVIYRRLDQGGLSVVFSATDIQTDRVVVIKVSDPAQLVRKDVSYTVEPEDARSYWAEMLERMRREADNLSGVDHKNIVRFYGFGLISDDLRYVVMEFLYGRTLRQEIDARGQIEIDTALNFVKQVCDALIETHRQGIVHRDINPNNIFLSETDELPQKAVKLIDFGIAKFPQPPGAPSFTQFSSMRGTVAYASPEQCQGHNVDHRSDIYSLGVVLYELLTGQRPFNGRTPTEIALHQIQSQPKEPRQINDRINRGLNRVILRALEKAPENRFASIEEFAGELEASTNQIIVPLSHQLDDMTIERRSKDVENIISDTDTIQEMRLVRRRRRRVTVAALALAVMVIVAGVILASRIMSTSSPLLETGNGIESGEISASKPVSQPSGDSEYYIPGSDADSLELAARNSSTNGSAKPDLPIVTSKITVPSKNPIKPVSPKLSPTLPRKPVNAGPKSPGVREPVVLVKRIPSPTTLPDEANSPRKDSPVVISKSKRDEVKTRQSESTEQPSSSNGDTGTTDSDTDYGLPVRSGDIRPEIPRVEKRREVMQVGPKLIEWTGEVRRVRRITIEMPGVPGTIEIPRAYRDRVGVVEPPNPGNEWRCAVLRVFGRGNVSIIIRWWPLLTSD